MIAAEHLLKYVIRPVLRDLNLWSLPAERLVLGTACKESDCGLWLMQHGGGPAVGIYQMEPATESDCWDNYLQHRPELMQKVNYWRGRWGNGLGAHEMTWNLAYATAMCRVKYLRDPEPIPDNLPGQAAYWKRVYNSEQGRGTAEQYIAAWRRFVPSAVEAVV